MTDIFFHIFFNSIGFCSTLETNTRFDGRGLQANGKTHSGALQFFFVFLKFF